jgi:O-antigen ligase
MHSQRDDDCPFVSNPSLCMELTRLITPNRLWAAHTALVLMVAAWVGVGAASHSFGTLGLLLCCFAILSQALVPRFPVMALGTFVVAAGVLPRYGEDNLAMLELGLLNWLALLGLSGWGVWLARSGVKPPFSHPLLVAMLIFIVWGGLSLGQAAPELLADKFSVTHHPQQYLQAGVLMLIASTLLADRAMACTLALLMCTVPIIRGLLQTNAGIYLDADVALLAVMGLPFALLGVMSSLLPTWQRAGLALVAAELLRIVLVAQNRGAALGLALALCALWLSSRNRLRWLLAASPLVFAAALLVPQSYVDRFSVLWDPTAAHSTASLDRSTIESRLQLWRAGVQIVKDNPWLGVGPGNYPKALATYLPGSEGNVAHNSVLSVAAEFGLVGATTFVVLFVGGLLLLHRLALSEPNAWPRNMACMVQASLAGWVGVGLVLTRPNMQLAYLLLGWAVALSVQSRVVKPSGGAKT